MASKDPFLVDNMTVDQILKLGDDEIGKMNKRELSRAVRTTALAANKRLNRLKAQAKKQGNKYVEKKSAKHAIALDALNAITNDGKTPGTFSAKGKTRNELLAEYARIKHFMGMKTSTLKGAENVRKDRERRLFGETREEAAKKAKKKYIKDYKKETGKKPIKKFVKKVLNKLKQAFIDKPKEVWAIYRKYLEHEHLQDDSSSAFFRGFGYTEVIEEIGEAIMEGEPEEKVLQRALEREEQAYIEEQDEYLKAIDEDFGLELEMSQDPFEF